MPGLTAFYIPAVISVLVSQVFIIDASSLPAPCGLNGMRVSPFQISSHVKAIDAIYQGTQFKDIRNISFMVKRIRVSLSSR